MRSQGARMRVARAHAPEVGPALSPDERRSRRLRYELGGLGLIALGLVILLSFLPETGFLSGTLHTALVGLVGPLGANIFACGLIGFGFSMMVRRHRMQVRHNAWALTILFLVFLAICQMPVPVDGVWDRRLDLQPGGLVGLLVAEACKPLFGRMLSVVILVLVGIGALATMSDTPLTTLAGRAVRGVLLGVVMVGRGVLGLRRPRPAGVRPRVLDSSHSARRLPEVLSKRKGLSVLTTPEREPGPTAAPPATPAGEPKPIPSGGKQLSLEGPPASKEYTLPPIELLSDPAPPAGKRTKDDTQDKIEVLEATLSSFGIDAKVVEIERGPRVTRYEVQPPPGVRVSRITNLADDLALSLAALDVRVEAPVPGKGVIGIEVPNKDVVYVSLKEIMLSEPMLKSKSPLVFALGKDISGHPRVADLIKMPHLLIAGATNSGKSVCINSMVASILYRATPEQVKFLMVDPKRVELSLFAGIPHLLAPVAYDAKEAAGLLRWAIREMEMRYQLFADHGVRNIAGYNERAAIDAELQPMYYMVIVIDELADLMMQAATEFETSICRLAQLARATGIHLVVATQRPSVNVITGTIKANIASRIAFAVASQVDSRTILDVNGAERLVGSGDMLYLPIDASKPVRLQGAYVDEKDINRLVEWLRNEQGRPEYVAEALPIEGKPGKGGGTADGEEDIDDDMFERALDFVLSTKYASASMLQRKLRIGYTRAARLIDMMHERGYVGPADGSRPREVYPQGLARPAGGGGLLRDEEDEAPAAWDDEA